MISQALRKSGMSGGLRAQDGHARHREYYLYADQAELSGASRR
jgi:hypothetical protein